MTAACLDETRAAAFATGDLPTEEREQVIAHAEDCDECRRVLASLVRGAPVPDWSPGLRVGRYIVRERIGRGGMGAVWRAEDLELHRPVALKRLLAGADQAARTRLIREARATAQLQHPNVVAIYEVGEADGEPFLAMELVDGETLTVWLRTPRARHVIVDVLVQAGRGLAAAHASGLVHRDLKPDNVLIDREGRARVVDFGLARAGDEPAPRQAVIGELGALTQTGMIAGTPAYLAPELVNGAPPDERSDQYAFAITCFQALHGLHPFSGDSAEVMWTEMAAGRIREGRHKVPARLDRIVRRGLAVDPAARWPSVGALVDELAERRRRRWPWFVAGGVVAAANLIGVLMLRTPDLDSCKAGAGVIDQIWNPRVRDAQARRLSEVAPHRASTIALVGRLTDDWVAAWRLAHDTACHADDEQRHNRLSCLDRQLGDLRAQLATWEAPDAKTAEGAVSGMSALNRPEACSAAGPPIADVPPATEMWLSSFEALQRALRYRQALPLVPDAIAMAEATGDGRVLARTLVSAGIVELRSGLRERAREHYARAARVAASVGNDSLTLEALMLEGSVAIEQGRPLDALGLFDAGDALAARSKLDGEFRVSIGRGDALSALGRVPEAIESFRRGIAMLEPRAVRDRSLRLELANALGALGAALGQQRKREEAAQALHRALAIEELELGSDSPAVARTLHDLGNQELALGKTDDAAAHFQRSRDLFAESYGDAYELVAATDVALADIERERGHTPEAKAKFERALRELSPNQVDAAAAAEFGLAQCAGDVNDLAGAVDHYRRAIALFERASKTGSTVADTRSSLALTLVNLGRFAEARAEAERSLVEYDDARVGPENRLDAYSALAEVEHHANHDAQAIAYLRKLVAATAGHDEPDSRAIHEQAEADIRAWSK